MQYLDVKQIKKEIIKNNPKKWWGDDFDVRFYLISKLIKIQNKKILDIGGGVGIILSKIDESNWRINLDISFDDLKMCKYNNGKNIQNICASMTNLPFKENCFDYVIAANVFEVLKLDDIKNNRFENGYPSINKLINEIYKITKINGKTFVTTPNNEYYKTNKLTYNELKNSILPFFSECSIFFYNTYPKLFKKYRKLNMANIIPKLLSRIIKNEKIIKSLCKTKTKNDYSVSFFVEAKKLG